MSLLSFLTGRSEPPPPSFGGFEEQDSPALDPPTLAPPHSADNIEGLTVAMAYEDVSGFKTRRRLRCETIWRERNAVYIRGWCFLRRDERTFRVDRIAWLMRPPNIEEPDPLSYFGQFLANDPFEKAVAARRALYEARRHTRDGLLVLGFIAQADGKACDREWQAVRTYIETRLARLAQPLDYDVIDRLVDEARGLFPTARQVSGAARRIEEEEGHIEVLAPHIEALIRADGRVHEEEIAALRHFRTRVERVRKT
jgi:hypothetical protein